MPRDRPLGRKPRAAPRKLEAPEQARGVQLLTALGGKVYEPGRPAARPDPKCLACLKNVRARQTPGVADVRCFLGERHAAVPHARVIPPRLLEWECKAPGRGEKGLSVEQREYRDLCVRTGIWHVVGDYTALVQALVNEGYLKAENVPHYRLP
jgi:hypothetical protein